MGIILLMPMINVNDQSVELVSWSVNDGDSVRKGDTLCVVETTKSAVEVIAEADGVLRATAPSGQSYEVGYPIGFIAESAIELVPDLTPPAPPPRDAIAPVASQMQWTKKAKISADRLGIDLVILAKQHPGEVVNEDMVKAAARDLNSPVTSPSAFKAAPINIRFAHEKNIERILILGGGGGAALVLDILARKMNQAAVGILDNNPKMAGMELMGIPILGGFELVDALWRDGAFDAVISTIVRDVFDRAKIYNRFIKMGIPFTNVIDPEARIGRDVILGKGNLIIYGAYLATGVKIGNNNFLAAGTFIEHHSEIGNHCTFGPRTSLAGAVSVGDHVKFGMQVAIEPQLKIGSESVIASGVVVTSHVPARTLVKSTTNAVFRTVK
ncbi:biotin/lipoyl-containing protein [Dechloromonas sp. ZS-1]|uniref:biotin/lipoyl-containing protein n=1 Tax=Dechloromonas sp. ZS-1 TaxID=3138067 RepID=UPI0031FDBF70